MSRYRKNGPAFQTGSTQKLTLVVILAISFIAIVIVIARMALHNVQQKIQADAVDALQTVRSMSSFQTRWTHFNLPLSSFCHLFHSNSDCNSQDGAAQCSQKIQADAVDALQRFCRQPRTLSILHP